MKKALLLSLVALLMVGCGGGGGTTTSSNGIPGGDTGGGGGTPTGPVGYITVVLPEGTKGPATLVPVRSGAPSFQSLRNMFRVVVKRMDVVPSEDEEGNPITINVEAFRVVKDSLSTEAVTIAVPAGSGYVVEVLTYNLPSGGTVRSMLEYGKTAAFDVVPGDNPGQPLTLTPVSTFITMTIQDNVTRAAVTNVTSGFPYNVNLVKTVPLRQKYYLGQTANAASWPIASFVVGYDTDLGVHMLTASNVSFTAPTVVETSNLYLQGQFFIDDSLLSAQERVTNPPVWPNWRINCPDPAYNEQVGVPLLQPGIISIIINPAPGSAPSMAATGAASSPNSTDATLSGTVNPNGSATIAWFEWGTTPTLSSYNSTAPQDIGSGTTNVPVDFLLGGLNAGTIYYFRMALQNGGGTFRGNIASFMTLTTWVRTFGGIGDDSAEAIRQTSDGGYIVAGYTNSFIGAGPKDIYLIKADAFGNTLWMKTFHLGETNGDNIGNSVQQTSDGGYIIAGTAAIGVNDLDICLIKTDPSGNAVWTKTFGGTGIEFASAVQQTSDGGYIIAGGTDSFGAGDNNAYLVKTDPSGNAVWTKTFGGTGIEFASAVQQTSDRGYIIAGGTNSFGAGNNDVYLIKADASGNVVWTKTFGGTGNEFASVVQQVSAGGYIIAGRTSSFGAGNYDVYLVRTDASGNAVWTKTFGGTDYDVARTVQQISDGGYIIAGITRSFGAGGRDVLLIKTDASGNAIWTKTFGGTGDEWGTIVRQTLDGGYIIGGRTPSFGAGGDDVYLIKTDANGN